MAHCIECRHIMKSGVNCKSPAMRGSSFCYFHGRPALPTRKPRSREEPIEIPGIVGPRQRQATCNQIIQALAANRISPRRAAVLLQCVQFATAQSADPGMPADLGFDLGDLIENLKSPKGIDRQIDRVTPNLPRR